ncbi:hypothetical protein ACRAWG_32520 [Methylobacterium sp. P31]
MLTGEQADEVDRHAGERHGLGARECRAGEAPDADGVDRRVVGPGVEEEPRRCWSGRR